MQNGWQHDCDGGEMECEMPGETAFMWCEMKCEVLCEMAVMGVRWNAKYLARTL